MSDIPDELIPSHEKRDVGQRHEPIGWGMFAKRIQKHPFVQEFVITRDRNCLACGLPFRSDAQPGLFDERIPRQNVRSGAVPFQVHHKDYDHCCEFGRASDKHRHLPDCESCYKERRDLFDSCVSRLAAVHPRCNREISKLQKRALLVQYPHYCAHITQNADPATGVWAKVSPDLGTMVIWTEISKLARRRMQGSSGVQELTGRIIATKDERVCIQVVRSRITKNRTDEEIKEYGPIEVYKVGRKLWLKRDTLMKRGARKAE